MKKSFFFLAVGTMVLAAGCEPEPEPIPVAPTGEDYAYVLNEGLWGYNNAEISRINTADGSIEADWFTRSNGRGLGDVAQDLVRYGNKLYATVYMSNTVEVIDPATGRSIKQIDMGTRGPRYMACEGGKVYVSCYDKSVVRIDTATLDIEAACPLSGMQPEQLCAWEGKLYVCSSWQNNSQGGTVFDSTLCVVDIATFSETGTVTLRTDGATHAAYNPGKIKADGRGHLYVACAGDYAEHPAVTLVYSPADGTFVTYPLAATNFDIYNGDIFLYNLTYDADWHQTTALYRNGSPILQSHAAQLSSAYGINLNPANGDIYVCNSQYGANGDVYCFAQDGTERWHTEAGMYASKVVF